MKICVPSRDSRGLDGAPHGHFGSASFLPGVTTHLSRFMIVSPPAMLAEAARLREIGVSDALERTTISGDALVVTPYQRAANRLRELSRGDGRHGSCGMGIGETASDALRPGGDAVFVRDLLDPAGLRRKLRLMRDRKLAELAEIIGRCRDNAAAGPELAPFETDGIAECFAELGAALVRQVRVVDAGFLKPLLDRPGCVIFEGAQGVLLDEARGFHPYTTWSKCTAENALSLLGDAGYDGRVTRLGLVRAYATRHGPGPFVTEDAALTAALPDAHNVRDDWQRDFRVGWPDLPATRYAIAACGGIDALAVSCLDRLEPLRSWSVCDGYDLPASAANIDRYFVRGERRPGLVTDIRLGPARDLAYQAKLTELLLQARPAYAASTAAPDFAGRCREHLGRLAAGLGAPVFIASYGPTAGDKRFLF